MVSYLFSVFIFLFFIIFFFLLFKKEWYFLYLFPIFFSISPRFNIFFLGGGRPVEIRLEDVLLVAIILVVIFKSFFNKKYFNPQKVPIFLLLALFIFSLVFSTAVAYFRGVLNYNNIFSSIFFILKFIEFFLFFYFTVALAKKYPFSIKPAFIIFIILGLINSFWIIYQGLTNDMNGVGFFSKLGFEEIYSQISGGWSGKLGWERPTLLFDLEPSASGGYFMSLISLTTGAILFLKKKIRYIIFLFLCLIAVGFGLSRTGLVVIFTIIVISPGLYFILHYKKMENFIKANFYLFIGISIVCLILISFGINFFTYYLPNILSLGHYNSQIYDPSARTFFEIRLPAFEEHIQTWMEYPIIGHGVPYKQIVDNFYLWVMINAGLFGLFSLIFILLYLLKYLWNGFQIVDNELFRAFVFASLLNIIGLLIFMFSFDAFMQVKIMEPFWFIQGLGVASILISKENRLVEK